MAKHTIKIKKYADVIEEYSAVGVITPGMLIEVTSADKVQPHSSSEGVALAMFALEDELQGRGIDVNFAADEKVQCWLPVMEIWFTLCWLMVKLPLLVIGLQVMAMGNLKSVQPILLVKLLKRLICQVLPEKTLQVV